MNDEFYIGWEAKAAVGIGGTVRKVVLCIMVLAVGLPLLLAAAQRMIGESVFEWGNVKIFSGVLQTEPHPRLLVPRPGASSYHTLQSVIPQPATFSAYYLVAPWKFGLNHEDIAALDGKPITLRGTLIYRGNQTMIEVVPNSIQATNTAIPGPLPQPRSLGRQTLRGEIVDSKCFLGVMNPGQLTPHRACAIRCISGGVPPVLLVRQENGPASYLLLVSADGKPVNEQVLDVVAEPIEITGEVERQGELMILYSDPATYRRAK